MKTLFMFFALFTSFHMESLCNVQILVTNNPMNWHAADEICTVEFKGSGYRHLAADISDESRDRCSLIVIRHRRFLSYDFKYLCLTVNDSVKIQEYCPKPSIVNITSPYMVERLRQNINRFKKGEEFIISNVSFSDYTDFKCEMARKRGHEFRKMFTRCNEFHRALCEHHTTDSVMVTTIEYREDTREYTSVFVPHPANPGGMYPIKDSNESDTEPLGVTGIVMICLSAALVVMSLSFCTGLFIYCRRKKMTLSSVYDTIFMRPRGRNPYTLRVPNDPTSPISERPNLLPPPADLPSAPPVRHQFIRAPAVRHQPLQQAPPMARVDSMQTLASSSSFVPVGRPLPPRIEIQPSTPSASERSYCSSCRRNRRKRDFLRTSSNCTSCVSQSSLYTQVARPAQRNLSQDTNDTNSLRSQRTSRDTNDTNSIKSHRSHRSGRNHSRGVSSKISRLKSQADYLNTEQIATPRSSAGSQHDVTDPNPVTRRHKLVDRLGSSSGFRLVKRMFSIDLK
uniref:Uncharacterized protein n=1 Tax=Magallana gigas TaxID=29159 RepID=A0A8W8KBA5_MAGGI